MWPDKEMNLFLMTGNHMQQKTSLLHKLHYLPRLSIAILNLLFLFLASFLFFGRMNPSFRLPFLVHLFPEYYTHISNFSISFILLSNVGLVWLLLGIPYRYLLLFGLILVVANLVYEQWVTFINTKDTMDMYYGFAGIILALVFLFITKTWGLRPNHLKEQQEKNMLG